MIYTRWTLALSLLAALATLAVAQQPPGPEEQSAEREWQSLGNAPDVPALEAFRRKFPHSRRAHDAYLRIGRLEYDRAMQAEDPKALREVAAKYPEQQKRAVQSAETMERMPEVRQVLERYVALFQKLDLDGLLDLMPTRTADLNHASQMFYKARSVTLTVQTGRPFGTRTGVLLPVERDFRMVPKEGPRSFHRDKIELHFFKKDGKWQIE